MKRKISFTACKTDIPVLRFALPDGTSAYMLVDTGAESTHIDFSFIKQNKKHFRLRRTETKMKSYSFTGEKDHQVIYADVDLTMHGQVSDFTLPVTDAIVYDMGLIKQQTKGFGLNEDIVGFIGDDMLKKLSAKIDFRKKEITFDIDERKTGDITDS